MGVIPLVTTEEKEGKEEMMKMVEHTKVLPIIDPCRVDNNGKCDITKVTVQHIESNSP